MGVARWVLAVEVELRNVVRTLSMEVAIAKRAPCDVSPVRKRLKRGGFSTHKNAETFLNAIETEK